MHALIVLVGVLGCVTGQIITQSGCTCKSFTQVQWRLSGGGMGGGFSHNGCSTGPYEDKSPGKGHPWCDTQESSCSNGEGWDLCTPSPTAKPTPRLFKGIPEAVNVNMGANPNAGPPGVSLNVNVNVGGSDASVPIKTVQGCTCHATSEVILTQNGVRVGGGFSHTGCGTGPYEANSPGHGSPWCDTVETWCAAGWDLCIPPPVNQPRQSSYSPPLPPLPPPNSYSTNSFTAYTGAGTFQPAFPPTPYFVPPTPQPWVPSYQPPAFQPPAVQAPAYQPPATPTILTPVPVAKVVSSQPRSPFASQKGLVSSRLAHKVRRGPPRGGGSDYDYDDSSSKSSSSSSALLPWMLMNGASSSTSSSTSSSGSSSTSGMASLLPFMLSSRGGSAGGSGSSSSMLPMMMMMSGSGGMNSNSMLSQFAMLNAFREGDGEAQNATGLGDIGQSLGFTRAVVSKTAAASSDASTSIATDKSSLPPSVSAASGSGGTDESAADNSSQSAEQSEIADGLTGNNN